MDASLTTCPKRAHDAPLSATIMPAFTTPFLAWAATVAELVLGVALISGVWPRWVALASALLLFLFGTAMAMSFGLKSLLDYSVFSASAAAVLLALCVCASSACSRRLSRDT